MTRYVATKNTEAHMKELRFNRNRMMYLTDWVFNLESPFNEVEKEQVRVYRRALKDCTKEKLALCVIPNFETFDIPEGVKKYLRDMI